MADITWAHVLDIFPTLSTVDADEQTAMLVYVNDEALDSDLYGGEDTERYRRARVYLCAHMALLARVTANGTAGPVTSQSAGGISRSYAAALAAPGTWGQTGPGQLLKLISVASRAPIVV